MSLKEVVSNLSGFFVFGAGVVIPFLISNKIENVKSIKENVFKFESFLVIISSEIESNLGKLNSINSSLNRFIKLKFVGHGRGIYLHNKRKKYLVDIIIKNIKCLKKINLLLLINYKDNELIDNMYIDLYEYNKIIDDINDSLYLIEKDNLKDFEVLKFVDLISPLIEKNSCMIKNIENISKENSKQIIKLKKYLTLITYSMKFLLFLIICFVVINIICIIFYKINLLSNPNLFFIYYGVSIFGIFFASLVGIIFGMKKK